MDPLSITASVLTIASTASKAGDGLQQLLHLVDAPNELASLINEVGQETEHDELWSLLILPVSLQVSDLKCELELVRDAARSLEPCTSESSGALESLQTRLARTRQYLQELDELVEYQLKRNEQQDKKGRPKVSRSAWLSNQAKLKALPQRLRDCRLGLANALSASAVIQG